MIFDELDAKMRTYEQSLDQVLLPDMYMVARLFSSVEDIVKIRPRWGGGTDYKSVFSFIRRTSGHAPSTSIVIITDGEGVFPDHEVAGNIPVLWLFTKECTAPWGKSVNVTDS